MNWRGLNGTLSAKGNFYYTKWEDRSLPRSIESSPGVWDVFFLTGLNQLHTGVEFELAYQPMSLFRIDVAGSVGNWTHTDDATGEYRALDSGVLSTTDYEVGVKDLKIGDAPATQIALAGSVFPIQGLSLQGVFRYYDEFYADWDPVDRIVFDGAAPDRVQSWQVPSYNLVDFHGSYLLPFEVNGVTFKVFAHIFNALDEEYISDALDNSPYNGFDDDHDADDAEVYLGIPRSFNVGVTINY